MTKKRAQQKGNTLREIQKIVSNSLFSTDYKEIYDEFILTVNQISRQYTDKICIADLPFEKIKLKDVREILSDIAIEDVQAVFDGITLDEIIKPFKDSSTFEVWFRNCLSRIGDNDDKKVLVYFGVLICALQKYREVHAVQGDVLNGIQQTTKPMKISGAVLGGLDIIGLIGSVIGWFIDAIAGPWTTGIDPKIILIIFSVIMVVSLGLILMPIFLRQKVIKADGDNLISKYQKWLIRGSKIGIRLKIAKGFYFGRIELGIKKAEGTEQKAEGNSNQYYIVCKYYKQPREILITDSYKEQKNWWKCCEDNIDLIAKTIVALFTNNSPNEFADEENGAVERVKEIIRNRISKQYIKRKYKHIAQGEYDYLFSPYRTEEVLKNPELWMTLEGEKEPFNKGIDENDKAKPIDYFFQYAIIDDNGKNAKNHFLVFPERYNADNGDFLWRIKLVVRDWNYAAIENAQYREVLIGGVNSPKHSDLPLPIFGFPLTKYNQIILPFSEQLISYSQYSGTTDDSGQGVIVNNNRGACILFDEISSNGLGRCDTFKLKNTTGNELEFHFSIDFYPKKVIQYRNRNLLSDDDFRLYIPKKVEGCKKVKPDWREGKILCPYCGRIVTRNFIHKKDNRFCYREKVKKGVYVCQHNFVAIATKVDNVELEFDLKKNAAWSELTDKFEEGQTTYDVTALQTPEMASKRLIVKDVTEGQDIDFGYGAIISILGNTRTGKSTFISHLFGMGERRGESRHDEFFIERALKPYIETVKLHNLQTLEIQAKKLYLDGASCAGGLSAKYLRKNYVSKRYDEVLGGTPTADALFVSHMPMVLKLNGLQGSPEKSWLSIFDIPGTFAQDMLCYRETDYTLVFRSNCWILLLNGAPEDSGETANLNIEEPLELLKKLKDTMKGRRKKPVIAVVLCKSDVFFQQGSAFAKGDSPYQHVRMSSPIARAKKFKNSKRHQHIIKCSAEIENYVAQNGTDGASFIQEIRGFKHCYFAVSAIGRSDAINVIKDETGQSQTKDVFDTNFTNIENVLIWLMYMTHIIE